MDTQPFVSVIIPAFNEERHMNRCLESVYEQSYPQEAMEILVVNGQSTDSTEDIVELHQQEHPNLDLLRNPRRNQAAAFNIGFHRSRGEIIIRMDAHTFYDRNYIQMCVEYLVREEYGNVGGRCLIIPGSKTPMGRAIALMNTSLFVIGGAAFRVGTVKKLVDTVPFGAFPREVIHHVGGMNETLIRGEDNEFNARIRAAGFKILFDPEIVSYYVARSTLSGFLWQMYRNGDSIGILLRQSATSVGIRHLVPLAFLLFLLGGTVLAILFPWFRWVFFPVLGLYFAIDLAFAVHAARDGQTRTIPLIFISTLPVHLVYGVGTLAGLFKGRYA
jgi:succinoglycan biosynthesis protein ExoA